MKYIVPFACLLLLSAVVCFAQTKDPIRLGVFLDMSGHTSSFGIATHNGIKMAVDEINAAGGIGGRKLEIFLEDNEGHPDKTQNVVRKLIAENLVHILIGDVASTNSLAAAYIAQAAKVPMITPASTNPKVTQTGDYIFRACFVDPFQGEAMAKFAFNELKLKRVAAMIYDSSDYSKGLIEAFTKTFTRLGGKIIAKETYSSYDPKFKTQLKKIRRLKPDAIYLPGYYGEVGVIARQARELKMNIPLLGGDGWDSPELWKLGGAALNNSYVTNHFAIDNPTPEVQKFSKDYRATFNSAPDALAALGYDTIYILADAIRRAETTDKAKLRDALAATKNVFGVTGNTTINDFRNAVKPAVILKLDAENAKFIYYATIKP